MPQFPLLGLPWELRTKIYEYALVSELEFSCHPTLWRPVAVDDKVFRIGYFRRDSVLPLLLANRQVYSEAIPVLYGKNTFFLRISGFEDTPLAFFDKLPSNHLPLLRNVFVQTGYHIRGPIDQYLRVSTFPDRVRTYVLQKPEVKLLLRRQDIAHSAKLIEQACPDHFEIHVNCESLITHSGLYEFDEEKGDLWGCDLQNEWVFSSWHLWKMMVIKSTSHGLRFEFRRMVRDDSSPPLSP